MIFISARALAETLELFPVAIHPIIAWLGINWAYKIAPYIDFIYGSLGYPLTPSALLEPEFPEEIHRIYLQSYSQLFNTPVWVISIWTFTLTWIICTYLGLTLISYLIAKIWSKNVSYEEMLFWIGIAFIPLINWWFYVGSETMFEILPQRIFIDIFPPYKNVITVEEAIGKPNVLAIEQYWDMWSIGFICLIWSAILMTGFISNYLRTNIKKTLIILLPWYLYFILLIIGSLNIYDIVYWLRKLGAWEYGLLPFTITIPVGMTKLLSKIDQHKVKWQRWRWLSLIIITIIYFWSIYPYPFTLKKYWGNPVLEWQFWWMFVGIFLTFLPLFMGRIACGWICPYAIFHDVMDKVKIPRPRIPSLFKKFRWQIFFGILIVLGTIEIFWEWDFFILYPRMFTLLAILFAFIWVPRAWCRYLCVLGAYAQMYSKPRLWGIKIDPEKCQRCKVCVCESICPADIPWKEQVINSEIWVLPDECWLCFKCVEACPYKAVGFRRVS